MTGWMFESSLTDWSRAEGLKGLENLHHAPEYLLNDSGQLSVISDARGSSHGPPSGGGSGTGSPASTLVGTSSGLEINLIWDSSVRAATNWSDIEHAVVSAAQIYTANFVNHAILN